MTNVTTVHHIFADTAAALVTGNVEITMLLWTGDQVSGDDIAADDDFLLSNAAGARIAGKRAAFAGDDLLICPAVPLPVNGITLTTLDGGVLYLWIRGK